jgi:hypothetical protein
MTRLLLFLILCIASTHLAFGQYDTYSLEWGGGSFFVVTSYNGQLSQENYTILQLGSNRMDSAEWKITASVKSISHNFPVNMLGFRATTKRGTSNVPIGAINNMMIWNNLQGLNAEVDLVNFQSLPQDDGCYHQLLLDLQLQVQGGVYLKQIPRWSTVALTVEYNLYRRDVNTHVWGSPIATLLGSTSFQVNIDPNSPGPSPVSSISVTPDVLLEFNSISDYMNGVTKTYTEGLKVSSTVNYEVRVKSLKDKFESTTTTKTLPLDMVSLQLSGVNGAQPAVNISTTNQLILQGATTNGNVVEYDMIYKAKPIEDQYLFINQQETFITQLMFELTTN